MLAHRYSWSLAHGKIPEEMCILHHCDVPRCVNPAHLFMGTRTDNNRDMTNKGRNVMQTRPELACHGGIHPASKLDEAAVVGIRRLRAEGVSTDSLAMAYGVTRVTINRVLRQKHWRHVA